MAKYQYSKLVMEKFLRRSFYDAVLELYEGGQGVRIISVSLEGNLSLVVNKDETFFIKLNEVAQRADDREEQHRFKDIGVKLEVNMDRFIVKKEGEYLAHASQPLTNIPSEVIDVDHLPKGSEDLGSREILKDPIVDDSKIDGESSEKMIENKTESDSFEKSSEGESDSEEESEASTSFHSHQAVSMETARFNLNKSEMECSSSEEQCFLPVGQVDEYKRKIDTKELDLAQELAGKKSPKKRRKISMEAEEDFKIEDNDKVCNNTASATNAIVDEGNTGGLQLLPHTATGPIIVEEDDNNYNSGSMSESQMAQLAMFQMRDPNMSMFRQQDLEELARQQQQWQMVAYQRSIMEKSYLQHQMQQYQRDTERLRWEYAAQRELSQGREYGQHGEDSEKLYRQTQSQTSTAEGAIMTAATLEEVKKSSRGETEDGSLMSTEKLPSQYVRLMGEEHIPNQTDIEFEEGELRPETHSCALCGTKLLSIELLIRHMEKHRIAFERSCSVCQSGTLTGNMLILHMEASHGPETSFPLPSSASAQSTQATSVTATSAAAEFSQTFNSPVPTTYTTHSTDDSTGMKLPQQPQSPKHIISNKPEGEAEDKEAQQSESFKSENGMYTAAASTSKTSEEDILGSSLPQDNFLGIPSQFYPLIGCQICGEKFALSEALDQHVDSQHKDKPLTYTCKPCCLTFTTHVEYTKHMVRHEATSANLKCSHCLKSFKSVKQLRLHYVAAHACCHFCEYCRAGFPDAVSLELHEQLHTLDPEKLTFRCDICSKAFYTQSQCSAHKRTHKDEKAHACEMCGSAFFKRGDLTKHVRTVHSPSRLFSCKFCGKKGTRMDNMRSHVRSHHKNMTRDQIINMIEVIE